MSPSPFLCLFILQGLFFLRLATVNGSSSTGSRWAGLCSLPAAGQGFYSPEVRRCSIHVGIALTIFVASHRQAIDKRQRFFPCATQRHRVLAGALLLFCEGQEVKGHELFWWRQHQEIVVEQTEVRWVFLAAARVLPSCCVRRPRRQADQGGAPIFAGLVRSPGGRQGTYCRP